MEEAKNRYLKEMAKETRKVLLELERLRAKTKAKTLNTLTMAETHLSGKSKK